MTPDDWLAAIVAASFVLIPMIAFCLLVWKALDEFREM